jgi:hypothetical protein
MRAAQSITIHNHQNLVMHGYESHRSKKTASAANIPVLAPNAGLKLEVAWLTTVTPLSSSVVELAVATVVEGAPVTAPPAVVDAAGALEMTGIVTEGRVYARTYLTSK